LGAKAPIEELLQMLIECDDLQAYYQPFFMQVGRILSLLSEWVTPERLLTSSNAEHDGSINIGEDQCAAIDILGTLKDFLPSAPKLIMNVLENPQQKQEMCAHTLFTLQEIGEAIPLSYLLLGLNWCYEGINYPMTRSQGLVPSPKTETIALLTKNELFGRALLTLNRLGKSSEIPLNFLL